MAAVTKKTNAWQCNHGVIGYYDGVLRTNLISDQYKIV